MKKHSFRTRLIKLILYASFGALIFISKILLEWAPNFHLVGALIMIFTVAFRVEAVIPLYVFVSIAGLYAGFDVWWQPYLYIWTILWGITLALPKKMSPRVATAVYMTVCGLHGLFYGVLYAPVQAAMFGFSFEQTMLWIAAGLPFDIMHAIGNLCFGTLIFPVSQFLIKATKKLF